MGRMLPKGVHTSKATRKLDSVINSLARALSKGDGKAIEYRTPYVNLMGNGVATVLRGERNDPKVYDVALKSDDLVGRMREVIKNPNGAIRILDQNNTTVTVQDPLSSNIFRVWIGDVENELELIEQYAFLHEQITYNNFFGISLGNEDGVYESIVSKQLKVTARHPFAPLDTMYRGLEYLNEGFTMAREDFTRMLDGLAKYTESNGEWKRVRLASPPEYLKREALEAVESEYERRENLIQEALDDGIESYPVVGVDGRLKENYMP